MGLLALAKKTVKELIELGYPEEVAKKIADGTLPMDEASRQARADAMGMTAPTYYRGHPSARPPTSNDDMFVAKERRDIAETYASGGEAYDEATDSYITLPGEVTPLRTNASKFIEADGMGQDWTYPTVNVPGMGTSIGTDQIASNVKRSREIQGNDLQGSLFTDVIDDIGGDLPPSDVANILGSQPEVMIRHADKAAFDPEYKGSNIMGGAAGTAGLAGLLSAGQSEDADAGFVTRGGKTLLEAWHGSPHKFDKFSMDQIGTGEGAQAYGHGLYFADEIDVAKGYQPRDRANEEWMYEQYKAAEEAGDQYMMDAWERAMMHDSPIELRASAADPDYDEYSQAAFAEVADALSANPGTGSLSRVEIDVTPESLLDWDKPLSGDTPQQMKDSINALVKANPDLKDDLYQAYREGQPGSIYYSLLSDYAKTGDIVKNQQFATQQLNDAGIKGIKYLDGDSRAVGDGTSNYVIFDDGLINIAERGNADPRLLAGVAGTTAAGLAAPMIKDSGMISAPRSETLFDLTMGARDLERRLEGSPASLLFPSGLVEYLETVNRREEDPNAMTRGMALLDVLPF